MRKLVRSILGLALLSAAIALAFAAGVLVAPSIRSPGPTVSVLKSPSSTRTEQGLAILQEAWRLIERDYYGRVPDQQTLAGGAVQGLLNALDDPFAAYQSASEVASYQLELDGSLQSLGMAVEKRNDQLLVVTPLTASPAQRAGIYPRDHIVAIDGRDTAALTLGEAIALLRGPDGTSVALTVVRNQTDVLPFTIERKSLAAPIFSFATFDGGVLYVNIALFDGTVARDMRTLFQQQDAVTLRGVILDLRNNPGGYLDVAIEAAGLFLSEGVVVSQQNRTGVYTWSFEDQGRLLVVAGPDGRRSSPVRQSALDSAVPVVIIVNQGTASAAEVLAAALQDHGRATLMGEQTFGKSAITGDYALSDGSSIHMTNGQWLSPKGRSVNSRGLTPDVQALAGPTDGDAVVQQALQWLLGNR